MQQPHSAWRRGNAMHGVSGTATNLFKVFSSDLRQRLIPLLWEAWGGKEQPTTASGHPGKSHALLQSDYRSRFLDMMAGWQKEITT